MNGYAAKPKMFDSFSAFEDNSQLSATAKILLQRNLETLKQCFVYDE